MTSRARVSAAPLLDVVRGRGGLGAVLTDAGIPPGKTNTRRKRLEKAYENARDRGWMTVYAADTFALEVLNLHPYLVWGDDWWNATRPPNEPAAVA